MKRIRTLRLGSVLVATASAWLTTLAASPTPAAAYSTYRTTVSYSSYTVAAGSMDMPTMYSTLKLGVRRPCSSCYLTGMQANLVYGDGSTANYDTGIMLHHVVFANQFHSDATCGNTPLGLAGERFFASGNERTPISLPTGYGYRLQWWDSWNMLVELMNMTPYAQTVSVRVTFSYVPASSATLRQVRPVWLDIDECGDSEYSIPAGPSDTSWSWTASFGGEVVAAAGHLHDYGVHISAADTTTGASICDSVAGYSMGMPPMGHLDSMTTCAGNLARVHTGDHVVLHSYYDSPAPNTTVMGIMLVYVHPM